MNSVNLSVLVVMGLLLAGGMRASGQQTARRPPEDIVGGASLLLETRPQNPRPRGRSGPGGPSKNIPTAPKPAAEESASKTDELEDALALGNALRDRKPPDFQSAEKAYRLGIKLDPEDPRPYAGLGNILYDQKRYPEASDAYREALRLSTPRGGISMRASGPDPMDPTEMSIADPRELRLDLVRISVQQANYAAAELQLRNGSRLDFFDAHWLAGLGSVLYLQGQFQEAADYFHQASQRDRANRKYEELRTDSVAQSKIASAGDEIISQQLQETQWRVSSLQNGVCRLGTGGVLRCDNSGRPFHEQMSWRIKEGLLDLFSLSGPAPGDRCTGTRQADQISMKCWLGNTLVPETWTRKAN